MIAMKLSKSAKQRIKMLTQAERKSLAKSARVLAECECITMKRADTIIRWSMKSGY
jgi:hypothetical protein